MEKVEFDMPMRMLSTTAIRSENITCTSSGDLTELLKSPQPCAVIVTLVPPKILPSTGKI
jgi:hypothetical protein